MSRSFVISVIAGVAVLVPASPALANAGHGTAPTRAGIGALGCPESGKLVVKGVTHDADFEKWANRVRAARADYCGDGMPH